MTIKAALKPVHARKEAKAIQAFGRTGSSVPCGRLDGKSKAKPKNVFAICHIGKKPMTSQYVMRTLGCAFVGGLIVLGLISLVDKIVAPETFVGRVVSTILMAVGLLIVWLTWELVVAEFEEAARRATDRAVKNVQRYYKMGNFER
jgi:hypothetical protein